MALKSRIDPIQKDIELIVNEMLAPAAQSRAIASFARDLLGHAQQVNRQVLGRIPPHTVAVDGRMGAPLESVRPNGGHIVFEFELVSDVLIWIGQQLWARSPFRSGEYRKGHTLFADGREVPIGQRVPHAEEYTFTNMVPYARKIEIGKTKSGRAFVIQVPNRIYERTAKDARARFGNIAKILFTYRGIVGGMQVNPLKAGPIVRAPVTRNAAGRFTKGSGRRLRGGEHNVSSLRFPTITVTPN